MIEDWVDGWKDVFTKSLFLAVYSSLTTVILNFFSLSISSVIFYIAASLSLHLSAAFVFSLLISNLLIAISKVDFTSAIL